MLQTEFDVCDCLGYHNWIGLKELALFSCGKVCGKTVATLVKGHPKGTGYPLVWLQELFSFLDGCESGLSLKWLLN